MTGGTIDHGYAVVYFCDPSKPWGGQSPRNGCGLFSFYKPEGDDDRQNRCPGCQSPKNGAFARIEGELAEFTVLKEVKRDGVQGPSVHTEP